MCLLSDCPRCVAKTSLSNLPSTLQKSPGVNGNGAVCDQKTSKFLVSHQEESMAGHVGVRGVY
jgi:hypothetical protein